jgi:hypothetical protein
MPRYKVALCHGYTIGRASGGSDQAPGLTASVLDTHWAHRETIRQAQDYCDALNAAEDAA